MISTHNTWQHQAAVLFFLFSHLDSRAEDNTWVGVVLKPAKATVASR